MTYRCADKSLARPESKRVDVPLNGVNFLQQHALQEKNLMTSRVSKLFRPGWQESELSHVAGMVLALCFLRKFLRVVFHCFPPTLDVSTFVAMWLYVTKEATGPSSERWNCGRESCPIILPTLRFPRKFRDLLHAPNLQHVTDGFNSPPNGGGLRIFCYENSCRIRSDLNPRS